MAENQDIVFKVRDPDGVVRLIPARLVEKAVLAGGVLMSADPTISRRPEAELHGDTQTARSKLAALGFKPEQEDTDDWTGIGIIGGVRKPKP